MQLFMTFHGHNIKAVKQPIYLLAVKRHYLFLMLRPDKFIFLKAFVIQHEAIVFPEQAFDFIAPFISEHIKMTGKWIVTQFTLYNGANSPKRLSKINRFRVKINLGKRHAWPHHAGHDNTAASCLTTSTLLGAIPDNDKPLEKCKVNGVGFGSARGMGTAIKPVLPDCLPFVSSLRLW
jgi:hypothetical protein